MYDYLDQPLTRLDAGSRHIIHAMRVWVDAAQRHTCPPRALAVAMPQPELRAAIGDLHRTMLLLHCHGTGPMPFGELKHTAITEGEAVMLALWASITADYPDKSRALIELMVSEAASAPMLAAMVRAAAILSVVGLAPAGRMTLAKPGSPY